MEEKIEYYQKKFHDISRTISLEEINDIRNEINLRKLQRKEEMTLKSEKESFQRKNQTESNAQIEQADSEEVLMILDLDDPDTIKILSQSL